MKTNQLEKLWVIAMILLNILFQDLNKAWRGFNKQLAMAKNTYKPPFFCICIKLILKSSGFIKDS